MPSLSSIRARLAGLPIGQLRGSLDPDDLQAEDVIRGVALLLAGWAIVVVVAGDVNPVLAFFTAPLSNLLVIAVATPVAILVVARFSPSGHRLALARRTLAGVARFVGEALLPLALAAAVLFLGELAFNAVVPPLFHEGFFAVVLALVLGFFGLLAGLALLLVCGLAYAAALVLIEVRAAGSGVEHRPIGRLVELAEALVALVLVAVAVAAGETGTIVLLGALGALVAGAFAVHELIGTGLEYDATARDLRSSVGLRDWLDI